MAFTSFSGNKRPFISETARKASFDEIPIISLTAAHDELISSLRDACTRVGFFYIADSGVPQDVISATFATAERFFDQDAAIKNRINYKKSSILRGYEPPAEVRTDESKRPDLNEAFNWGYERELDPLYSGSDIPSESMDSLWKDNPMVGPNAWPELADFKRVLARYYGAVLTLARRLIRLLAEVLQLPTDYFDSLVSTPGAMGRLIHYAPQPAGDADALGIGAHTDIECFTILCQGEQPGLQILNVAGEWIEAPPLPGTFVVNIGDMLARWSNDVFISTVHRVLNTTGRERYSIPFFFGANYDAVVEPLHTCVAPGELPKYQPVVAGDYVWRRLAQSRLDKKEIEARVGMGKEEKESVAVAVAVA